LPFVSDCFVAGNEDAQFDNDLAEHFGLAHKFLARRRAFFRGSRVLLDDAVDLGDGFCDLVRAFELFERGFVDLIEEAR
jgi:hypothetical protein